MIDFKIAEEFESTYKTVAAQAIARFTPRGGLVIDLGCGTGCAIVEAIRTDRFAIGIERNGHLAREARDAVCEATANGGPGFAAVVVGELAAMPQLIGTDSVGKAALVLVDLGRVGVIGVHSRSDRADVLERLAEAMDAAHVLLRAGGHVVVHADSRALGGCSLSALLAEIGVGSDLEIVQADLVPVMRSATARSSEVLVLRRNTLPVDAVEATRGIRSSAGA